MVRSCRVEPESMVVVVTAFYCQPQSPGFGLGDWGQDHVGLDKCNSFFVYLSLQHLFFCKICDTKTPFFSCSIYSGCAAVTGERHKR